jgi:hypothetical protein
MRSLEVQVGQLSAGGVGQFYIGANNLASIRDADRAVSRLETTACFSSRFSARSEGVLRPSASITTRLR